MQQLTKIALAAAIGIAGIGLTASPVPAAQTNPTSEPSSLPPPKPPTLPTGVKPVSAILAPGMSGVLANATRSAVEPGNFDELINTLVDSERDRIGDFRNKKFTDLEEQARAFQKAWMDKYKGRFDIESTATFSDASGAQGLVENSKEAAAGWPVSAQSGATRHAEPHKPAPRGRKGRRKTPAPTYGPQIGVVHLLKAGDAPALYISLADESSGWKIVIPARRTGQQIHDDLLKKLTALNDDPTKWPDNRIDASRMVVNTVLGALYGVDQSAAKSRGAGKSKAADKSQGADE